MFCSKNGNQAVDVYMKKFCILLSTIVLLLCTACSDGATQIVVESGDSSSQTNAQSGSVSLTKTYTNEKEGLLFKHPDGWKVVGESKLSDYYDESELENVVALLANEQDDPKLSSYIEILKYPATKDDIDYFLSSTESTFKENFDANVSITDLSSIDLDGVSARMVSYNTSDDIYYRSYFYNIGYDLYRINFMRQTSQTKSLERFFDAIMDSYTITRSAEDLANTDNSNTGEILYKDIPVSSLLDLAFSDLSDIIGEPLEGEWAGENNYFGFNYGDIIIYAYPNTGELTSIVATDSSAFSVGGVTLDKDRAGVIEIFGDPTDEWDDRGYGMFYHFENNIDMYVSMNSPDEKAYEILIKPCDCPWGNDSEQASGTNNELPDLGPGFEWVEAPHVENVDTFGVKIRTIVGVIKNTRDTPISVWIEFTTYDSAGNQIGNAYDIINDLGSGNTWKFGAEIHDNKIDSWEFAEIRIKQ